MNTKSNDYAIMLRKIYLIFILIFSILFSKQLYSDTIPDVNLSSEYKNTYIRIFAPSGWNTFEIGDPVTVAVEVIGSETIKFRSDYEIRGYYLQNEIWNELKTYPIVQDHYYFLLSSKGGDMKNTGAATIYPIFNEVQTPMICRIVVIGYIYENQLFENQQVAAYTDIVIFR